MKLVSTVVVLLSYRSLKTFEIERRENEKDGMVIDFCGDFVVNGVSVIW